MFKDLSTKIILAISYTDQFKYPLTKEEIFLRLIGESNFISLEDVTSKLDSLVDEEKIFSSEGFYFLKPGVGRVETRLRRKKYSLKKWLEVKEFAELMKFIPWIRGVAVTGSLAVNNAKKNDDVDFLIITQEKRLWLSRVLVAFFLLLKGKKRSWSGAEANSWCLNFWLNEACLELPDRLKNIYGAFEVAQAIWVYDRGDIKKKFFESNNWAEKFLPNYFNFQKKNKSFIVKNNSNFGLSIFNFLLDLINHILFLVQYLYMKPHMTSEKVDKSFAFFHPRDTKKQVFSRWLRKFKENES